MMPAADALKLLESKVFSVFTEKQLLGRILMDGSACYKYAKNVLHGPFKDGESAISAEPYTSFLYARDVLDGPYPLGEPAIYQLNDAMRARYDRIKNKQS